MKKLMTALFFIVLFTNLWSLNNCPVRFERNDEAYGGEFGDSIPDPWTLPEITWEELEGQHYTILVVMEDYIIIIKDGKYYIIRK